MYHDDAVKQGSQTGGYIIGFLKETLFAARSVATVAERGYIYIYYENRTRSTRNKKKCKKVQSASMCSS